MKRENKTEAETKEFTVLKPLKYKGKQYGSKDKISLSNPKLINVLTDNKSIK